MHLLGNADKSMRSCILSTVTLNKSQHKNGILQGVEKKLGQPWNWDANLGLISHAEEVHHFVFRDSWSSWKKWDSCWCSQHQIASWRIRAFWTWDPLCSSCLRTNEMTMRSSGRSRRCCCGLPKCVNGENSEQRGSRSVVQKKSSVSVKIGRWQVFRLIWTVFYHP